MGEARLFWTVDATLCVGTDKTNRQADPRRRAWNPADVSPDWETFNRLLAVLEARGFSITRDPQIEKRHPILGGFHRVGRAETPHGALEFHAETFPTGCRVEFYQDVVRENPHGGRYDFGKVARMPYLIRKKFEGARAALLEHLADRGFAARDKLETAVAVSTLGERLALTEGRGYRPSPAAVVWAARLYFNERWNMGGDRRGKRHRFDRDLFGWPSRRELSTHYGHIDADRRPIRHGETRWFRTSKGYLARGVVFGGINGQWLIITGPGPRDFTHRSAHELFGYDPARHPRKQHPNPVTLDQALARAVAAEDFERAIQIRNLRRRPAGQLELAA